jgi:hypothetical protein
MILPVVLAFAIGSVFAPDEAKLSSCALGSEATWTDRFDALPQPIQVELLTHVKAMAEPGDLFNPTDIGSGPRHRLIRAGSYGKVWFVWYEHGGLGYHRHVAFLDLVVSGNSPTPSARSIGNFVSSDLCAATKAFFDGIHPAAPKDW